MALQRRGSSCIYGCCSVAEVTMSAILPVLFSLPLLYLGLRWFQRYVTDAVCTSKARLDGKTVLITGGNSGIGKETAVELAKRGARVIAADKEGGLETSQDIQRRSGNSDVQFYKFDLASLASVREFSGQILAREPRLDILINNAGVAGLPYVKTEDGFESHIGVNHLGHFLLTNLLLERLKESPSARIIVVASAWHYFGKIQFDDLHLEHSYDIQKAYAQSKLANMLFMKSLARRLRGQDVSNVTVNAVHPGYVNTGMLIPKAAMPFLLVSYIVIWGDTRICKTLCDNPRWSPYSRYPTS